MAWVNDYIPWKTWIQLSIHDLISATKIYYLTWIGSYKELQCFNQILLITLYWLHSCHNTSFCDIFVSNYIVCRQIYWQLRNHDIIIVFLTNCRKSNHPSRKYIIMKCSIHRWKMDWKFGFVFNFRWSFWILSHVLVSLRCLINFHVMRQH